MALNIRGGIFYLNQVITKNNFEKMFPDGDTAMFKELRLFSDMGKKILIKNIKVKFLKKKEGGDRQGLVFRFVDISEEHLDILLRLNEVLPAVGRQEEMSIPSQDFYMEWSRINKWYFFVEGDVNPLVQYVWFYLHKKGYYLSSPYIIL